MAPTLTTGLARAASLCVAGAGAVIITVAGALALRGPPLPADFGALHTTPPAHTDATQLPGSDRPSRPPTAPPGPTRTGLGLPAPPAQVDLPTLAVRATVQPVAVHDGVLGVPADAARLGWWAAGAPPGADQGTVTIDGHVDTVSGPGSLFRLTSLRVGDPITVRTTHGQVVRYLVTGRRVYAKAGGLPADTFRTNGPPRLALITCGGPFDTNSHHYQDNIVVFASPDQIG